MAQPIDEILDDLRSFVAGRGSEDNFLWSKLHAHVPCVDFSPWFGMRLAKNDIFALAVFNAQLSRSNSQFEEVTRYNLADDGDELVEEDMLEEVDNSPIAFEHAVNLHKQKIKHVLEFPFEQYFANDIRLAKMDLLIAWLLRYSDERLVKVLMPYNMKLKNANTYLEGYYKRKKKQIQIPADLPNDPNFTEFQHELGKLSLAARLYIFKIFEYSIGFSRNPKPFILFKARIGEIDEKGSEEIQKQSKLIKSFPDGTGFISPEFVNSVSAADDYAKKIAIVYREWGYEVASLISDKLITSYYGKDPKDDNFFGVADLEE